VEVYLQTKLERNRKNFFVDGSKYGRMDVTSNSRSIRSSPRQWPNKYHKTRITLLGAHQCLRSFPSVPSINIPSAVGFSTQITTLGVIINKITFDSDVSVVCKKSFFLSSSSESHMACDNIHIHTTHTTILRPFSGKNRVKRWQKRTSGLYGARED